MWTYGLSTDYSRVTKYRPFIDYHRPSNPIFSDAGNPSPRRTSSPVPRLHLTHNPSHHSRAGLLTEVSSPFGFSYFNGGRYPVKAKVVRRFQDNHGGSNSLHLCPLNEVRSLRFNLPSSNRIITLVSDFYFDVIVKRCGRERPPQSTSTGDAN